MSMRDAHEFEDHVGPGVLGMYVQYMSAKTKTTIYRYLLMCKNRAAIKRETVTVVTNDPIVQTIAVKLGMVIGTDWTKCGHLYVFLVNPDSISDYLNELLSTIECEYTEVPVEYTPPDVAKKADLEGLTFKKPEANEMRDGYALKQLWRDNPNPYPVIPHLPTPMYQKQTIASSGVKELGRTLLNKYPLYDLELSMRDAKTLVVNSMAFNTKDRNKGYGTAVLDDVKEFCARNRIPEIRLSSTASGSSFYKKNGFIQQKTEGGATEYVYRLIL